MIQRWSRRCRQVLHPQDPAGGFTLPELLIAGIIAAAVAVMSAQVMINQLLEGRRLEIAQRNRENISRLNYLIQIEASESNEVVVAAGTPPPNCAAGGANSFVLWVPLPTGQYATAANRSGIQYSNNGGNIIRCGPPVDRNGVLRHGDANVTGDVVRNAQLVINPGGACPASDARQIVYQVTFPAGNAGQAGGCTVAHARSVFVCNPPVVGNPQIGDCP